MSVSAIQDLGPVRPALFFCPDFLNEPHLREFAEQTFAVIGLHQVIVGPGSERFIDVRGVFFRRAEDDHRFIATAFTPDRLDEIDAIADRVTVLDQGRVLLTGAPEVVRDSAVVRDRYLGGGA